VKVACVGLATRDTILRVPTLPGHDGRVVADELVVGGGGPAATAAVTLARLGVEVGFYGVVGDDDAGAFVRDGLAGEGVDVTGLHVVPGARTPQSVILVEPDGARSIIHRPTEAKLAFVEPAAEWVHVDHVGYSHASGRLSIDGGNPIDALRLDGVALYAPTAERLRSEFGDAERALASGAETVVVTRGAEGSTGYTRDGVVDAPGVSCDPVSTLGAGDVFHGALLAYLVRGAALGDALRAANTAAALSCRALDGRSAIPTLDELQRNLT
jgi:sugar/nucleoside kinase (ribokinase family)